MEKWLFLTILFSLFILTTIHDWKHQNKKTRRWILLITTPSLYFALMYAGHMDWAGFGEWLEWIYGPPSDGFVRMLESIR
ncbi:hypothetical protein [Cohnella fermenti]|uniref:hypothetical protein n=1 Tax=Cohnella fermenti TaxID=2565925 RepID=UPI001454BE20|nr:hypothetical protein [Cohnella fermenti]